MPVPVFDTVGIAVAKGRSPSPHRLNWNDGALITNNNYEENRRDNKTIQT